MDAADEISREYEARTRPGRLSPRLEITGEGMVLGAGTVLAAMEKDARGRPRLVLDERRAAAILSTALEHAGRSAFSRQAAPGGGAVERRRAGSGRSFI